jgi:hypothetical protein
MCREIGNDDGVARALANQALVLNRQGRPGEALRLAEEAHRLAEEHGYAALAEQIRPILDSLRSAG